MEAMQMFSEHGHFKLCRKLKKKALKLKGEDDEVTARNLFYWVSAEIEYKKGFFIKDRYRNARSVYRRGKGICLDHAVLYVSLARQAGLMACVAYTEPREEHAVAAVKIEGKVVFVDVSGNNFDSEGDYRLVDDSLVVRNVSEWNKYVLVMNFFKRAVVALALSGSLGVSNSYWYNEQIDKVIKETTSLVDDSYHSAIDACKRFGRYVSKLEEIIQNK